jgi:excisionase family DNA binding protein
MSFSAPRRALSGHKPHFYERAKWSLPHDPPACIAMNKPQQEWFSVEDLAEWLGVEKFTVYWLNSHGQAPPRYRIGRELRYRRSEVEQWLKERRQDGAEPALAGK